MYVFFYGVRFQCVSRVYPVVYPGCILSASFVYLWVYLGVLGFTNGAHPVQFLIQQEQVVKSFNGNALPNWRPKGILHNHASNFNH